MIAPAATTRMKTPLPPGPPQRVTVTAAADEWPSYAERIDVRSPGEYADDHLPQATNLPVLDDEERARVGTMYVQQSAFDARKLGAAIVARNIATICETYARDKPRDWSPLVYCWRGGQRSRALVHVLTEIGFRAVQLHGGYRAYRRHVVAALAETPQRFRFRVICGLTGSGKSRLIEAIDAEGGQVLDLERLARHRGSLLGDLPDDAQPSQKMFESGLYFAFSRFDAGRPVFVESESQRIGRLQVPESLLAAMRASPCIRLEAPQTVRVSMLEADYAHLIDDREQLGARLAPLAKLHGKATVERWRGWLRCGDTSALAADLLDVHYDPSYRRAIQRNFPRYRTAAVLDVDSDTDATFHQLARQLLGAAMAAASIEAS
jgi:tRNA 2-selenouridine synthase